MPDSEMIFSSLSLTAAAAARDDRFETNALLVERVCEGDERAFAELYHAYAPMVHGILLARIPREDVQDAVQEVFLAAYRNLRSLRDCAALGGWLARLARNQAVDYFRRTRPTEELTDEVGSPQERTDEAAEVLAAIRSLPEAYCETLVLRLVEGMSGKEIAERTGLKPESVRVNLSRGMEMLRQKLGINGAKQ